jgi:hypothetical protein
VEVRNLILTYHGIPVHRPQQMPLSNERSGDLLPGDFTQGGPRASSESSKRTSTSGRASKRCGLEPTPTSGSSVEKSKTGSTAKWPASTDGTPAGHSGSWSWSPFCWSPPSMSRRSRLARPCGWTHHPRQDREHRRAADHDSPDRDHGPAHDGNVAAGRDHVPAARRGYPKRGQPSLRMELNPPGPGGVGT